jgi:hypothetical protein
MFAQARIGRRQRETHDDERQHDDVKHGASDLAVRFPALPKPCTGSHTLQDGRSAGFDFQQNEASAQEEQCTACAAGSAKGFWLSYETPAKSLCRLHILVRCDNFA